MNETIPDRVIAELRAHEAKQDRLFDAADTDMQIAREILIERLKDGKKVGRCDLLDVLDCEMNSERYKITLQEIFSLLMGGDQTRDYMADQILQGLCERYVDSHEDLIEEQAAEDTLPDQDPREWQEDREEA